MPETRKNIMQGLNFVGECKEEYKVGLWQCPQFLFIVMGFITIVASVATYFVGSIYAEPEIVAAVVMGVAVIIFSIGHAVIGGFDQIAQINKTRAEFISITSHQLRAPLSAMRWSLGLLFSGRLGKFDQKQLEYLQVLKDGNERMNGLVNDLLDVNKIESGRVRIVKEPLQLLDVVESVVAELAPLAHASNIQLFLEKPQYVPTVIGDPVRVRMVITNFVDNAIKYIQESGRVTVSMEVYETSVKFICRDNGVGIPKDQQKRIFEKFFRADNVLKYQTKGTGLGLFLAKAIIESLEGKIGYSSVENQGSTFWFSLPREQDQHAI